MVLENILSLPHKTAVSIIPTLHLIKFVTCITLVSTFNAHTAVLGETSQGTFSLVCSSPFS